MTVMLQPEGRIITVYPLWQRGKLMLGCAPLQLNCNSQLRGTLRAAWLVPKGCNFNGGGDDYELIFTLPDPMIPNVLQGVWIGNPNGTGMVLNVGSILEIVSACDECCGSPDTIIGPAYTPTAPILPPQDYLQSSYYILRTDNGSPLAYATAEMDYYGYYISGTFQRNGRSAGITTYKFDSMNMPPLVGTDSFGTGVYKKMSNEAPPKDVDGVYSVMVKSTEFGNSGPWLGKTLADIVYQLQTQEAMVSDIAVSVQQNRIVALTIDDTLTFTISAAADQPPVFYSNPIPATAPNTLYKLTIVANGDEIKPELYGTTLAQLISLANVFPAFAGANLFIYNTDQIGYSDAGVTSANLTLINNVPLTNREFDSQEIEPLAANTVYSLYVLDSDNSSDGPTLFPNTTNLLTYAQGLSSYGTWSLPGNTLHLVQPSAPPPYDILIDVKQVSKPASITISTPHPPAVPSGHHLMMTIQLDGIGFYPWPSGATSSSIFLTCQLLPPLSGYGTWSMIDTDRIELTTNKYVSGALLFLTSDFFFSNEPPVVPSGQVMRATVWNDNVPIAPPVTGPDLPSIFSKLITLPAYNLGGSWTATNPFLTTSLTLQQSTLQNIFILLDTASSQMWNSNTAPVVPVGSWMLFSIITDSVLNFPLVRIGGGEGTSTFNLATIAAYADFGVWSYPGSTEVQLVSASFDSAILTLAAQDFLLSNPAPTLNSGEIYRLRFNISNAFTPYDLVGPTLADLITNIPPNLDPALFGTLAVQVDAIRMTSGYPAVTDRLYITLEKMTTPVFISNAIGAVPAGQHINMFLQIGSDFIYSGVSGASIAALITTLNSFPPFNAIGTWAPNSTDKIQLTTTKYNPMTIGLQLNTTFLSNVPPALPAGHQYRLTGYVNDVILSTKVLGATVAQIVSRIPLAAEWAALGGNWTINSADQVLFAGGTVTNLYLVLDTVPIADALSNVAPAIPANQHITQTVMIGSQTLYPILSAGDVAFLRTRVAGIAPYSTLGTWTLVGGNQIKLSPVPFDPMTLALSASDEFISNPAPTLAGGQQLQLLIYLNTTFMQPYISGSTIAEILAAIPLIGTVVALGGTWSASGNQIKLTGSAQTGIYLVLQAATIPDAVSNAAPALPAGQHYTTVLTIPGGVQTLPYMSSATVAGLVNFLSTTAPYSQYGTWSVSGGDKVQITNPHFIPFAISVTAVDIFYSNQAPTLQSGQSLQLKLWNTTNGGFIEPFVSGATIAEILAAIPDGGQWATARQAGTWGTINNEVTLTGSTQTEIYMLLEAITTPVAIVSNAAPALPAGEHYSLAISATGLVINAPLMSSATVAGLVGFLSTTTPYNAMGTWSVSGGDKVQLANPRLSGLTITIITSNQFQSNDGDPQGAQTLRLRLWHNTGFITPDVTGATLLDVLSAIPNTGDWATAKDGGNWGAVGQTISLSGSTETEIYMLLIVEGTAFALLADEPEEKGFMAKVFGSTGKKKAADKQVDNTAKAKQDKKRRK